MTDFVRRRARFNRRVTNPRIVPTANAVDSVKPPWRQIMTATGIESSLLLTRAG